MTGNPKTLYRTVALLALLLLPSILTDQAKGAPAEHATGVYAIQQSGTNTYKLVATAQEDCWDDERRIPCPEQGEAFFGQDAQSAGSSPSYADHGDGTITDLVTGLMWQKTPGRKMTYAEALEGAPSLALADHEDWRLPTIKELYSLILFSGIDPSGANDRDPANLTPFIDTAFFDFEYGDTAAGERIIDAQYWSSTEYVSTTMNRDATVFGLNFADGRIKGYPRERGPGGSANRQFARYVRGNPDYGLNQLVDNGDGTISDRATGLMWMQDDSQRGYDWQGALAYAEGLEHAGHDDWRLPNAKELQSIVDYSRSPATSSSAAIDPLFNTTPITDEGGSQDYASYWSSTTHVNMSRSPGANAAYVAFGRALGFMEMPPGSGNRQLLDVHGAGAQRSDPKSGDPADWPQGHGPQGDVVRIYNHVRAVRFQPKTEASPTPGVTSEPTASPTGSPTTAPATPWAPTATPIGSTPPTTWSIHLPLAHHGITP
jgi:hypothetical protein